MLTIKQHKRQADMLLLVIALQCALFSLTAKIPAPTGSIVSTCVRCGCSTGPGHRFHQTSWARSSPAHQQTLLHHCVSMGRHLLWQNLGMTGTCAAQLMVTPALGYGSHTPVQRGWQKWMCTTVWSSPILICASKTTCTHIQHHILQVAHHQCDQFHHRSTF